MFNYKKTQILPVRHHNNQKPTVTIGEGGCIRVVEHFQYLGAYGSADGAITKKLKYGKDKAAGVLKKNLSQSQG